MVGTPKQLVTWLMDKEPTKQFEIKEHRERRTLTQNAYYWQLLGKIKAALGISAEEAHNTMLGRYGEIVFREDGRPLLELLDSDVDHLRLEHQHLKATGRIVENSGYKFSLYYVLKPSHEMSTKEMSTLVDGLVSEAKELDIETLPPHDLEAMRLREEEREKKHHPAG